MSSIRRAVASTVLFVITYASARSCGGFSQQVDTSQLLENFTTIEIGMPCPPTRRMDGSAVAIPAAIHWHITPLPGASLSVTANIEGLVKAFLSSDGRVLSFAYGNAIPFGGGRAGIEVVCPTGNFTTISSIGIANSVEVTDTSGSLKFLEDRGVGNAFFVTSTSSIQYAADSRNGTAMIDAPNVVVKMGGARGDVQVKGMTNAEISGIGNTLVVQGNATVSAFGVEATVQVNGKIESESDTGADNVIEATDATVTVSNITCSGPKGSAACRDGGTAIVTSGARRALLGGMLIACFAFLSLNF